MRFLLFLGLGEDISSDLRLGVLMGVLKPSGSTGAASRFSLRLASDFTCGIMRKLPVALRTVPWLLLLLLGVGVR
jgi:hypothetical protein